MKTNSTLKVPKLTKQMEKFYTQLNQFIEDWTQNGWLEDEQWDAEGFKICFAENVPKTMNTKKKKIKDPAEPKKSRGAYIFFSSDPDIRQRIRDENPDASPNDFMRLIGSLWSSDEYKNYNDEGENKDKNGRCFDYTEEADKYIEMADKDKKRFSKEMSVYTPNPDFTGLKKKKKTSKSAYMFFCNKMRGDAKTELVDRFSGRELQTEITKTLGRWWNEGFKNYHDEGTRKEKDGRKYDYRDNAQIYLDMAEEDKMRVKSLVENDSNSKDDDSVTPILVEPSPKYQKTKTKLTSKQFITTE